jgi:hypothetical protein
MAEEELELEHQHGKARVRVARLWRSKADGQPDDLVEWNVSVSLISKVLPAFTEGDNSNIVATDTIKNTVQISIPLFLLLEFNLKSNSDLLSLAVIVCLQFEICS